MFRRCYKNARVTISHVTSTADDMNNREVCDDATCLHSAVRSGNIAAVRASILAGVSVHGVDGAGWTPLLVAVLNRQPECVKLLIAAGSDVHFSSSDYGTALHIACSHGYLDIVHSLLLAGADCAMRGPANQTCLHFAAHGGHLNIVKALLFYKAPLNSIDRFGLTPLHAAVMENKEDVALCLIENGALVTRQDLKGNLPLHHAVKQKNITIIKALFAEGCDKDLMNSSQESPLHIAVRNGHLQTLLVLVKFGCRTDITHADGNTTIHTLVSKYSSQYPTDFRLVLEMLLYGGCDINTRAYATLETPLYRAISLAKGEAAEVLLAYGADPNLSSPFDITALRMAYMNKLSHVCLIILNCGIDWRRERWIKNVPFLHASDPNTILHVATKWQKQPVSLLDQCRIAFRRHCGKDLHTILVKLLDVPVTVKNFILFTELRIQKYNSFIEQFTGGSWVINLLTGELEYGPFHSPRKNDVPDIC